MLRTAADAERNITASSTHKNDVFVTVTNTISDFLEPEFGGIHHRPRRIMVFRFGFDMDRPTGVRAGYTA